MIKQTRFFITLPTSETLVIERDGDYLLMEVRNLIDVTESYIRFEVNAATLIELHEAVNEIEREVIGE